MNKDNRLVFGQNDIRLPGEPFVMQAEAVSSAMQLRPDQLFWLRILRANARHHLAAFLSGYNVSHVQSRT